MYPVISLGTIQLPTYLLIISLIYTTHLFWLLSRGSKFNFDRNKVLDVAMAVMIGGFVGARILHIVWEEPSYYLENPAQVFYFWQGGYVFFGGLIGAITSGLFVIRKDKLNWHKWLDLFAPLVASGYAIGRLSCLAAGCCYGKRTDVPWCITFPHGVEAPAAVCLHPTQVYASLWEASVLSLLLFLENKKRLKPGQLFFMWLALHAVGRIWQEYFRADYRGPVFLGVTVSTAIASVLFLFALYKLRLLNKAK
jgi:phosphatidylglycerol---prolipoprotein diacylglyceryl transferase